MRQTATDFYENLKGKKVAFIGAGVTNRDLIPIFVAAGANVTLCDQKRFEQLGDLGKKYKELGVTFSLGEGYLNALALQDMVMRSPGFEYYTKELVQAKEQGVEITSEMELFFALCPCKIYAVTGSDGKTTTTTLVSEMLKAEGKTVHLGGNIGRALLPVIDDIKPTDVAVVELSSFQLISMRQSPDVAVVTNITPNHLDHHKDMQEYVDAKRNILLYQKKSDKAVLGYENEITRSMQADVQGSFMWFSRVRPLENGAHLDKDGYLCITENGNTTQVVHKSKVLLPGVHNIENLLCATATVYKEVSAENMAKVASSFTGVQHRIEPVCEKNGVHWYNDSIATSPTRTIAGLRSFNQKLILIAGGYDKGIPYAPMAADVNKQVKLLILMGATAQKIETVVRADGNFSEDNLKIVHVNNMEEAVQTANTYAQSGDVVLFSPASASFDAYPNFEKRGEHFKTLVYAL